jgi:hypothetical protein
VKKKKTFAKPYGIKLKYMQKEDREDKKNPKITLNVFYYFKLNQMAFTSMKWPPLIH